MNSKQKKVRKHVKGVTFKSETPLDVLITCQLHTATFGYSWKSKFTQVT